jgi:hypothetical protein
MDSRAFGAHEKTSWDGLGLMAMVDGRQSAEATAQLPASHASGTLRSERPIDSAIAQRCPSRPWHRSHAAL